MLNYRNDIQAIRGICLIAVFVYHFNNKYLFSGFIGVDIFLMISGYVNTLSFKNKNNHSFIAYQFHRAIRLIPVSWVVLTAALYVSSKMNILYRKKLYLDILRYIYIKL